MLEAQALAGTLSGLTAPALPAELAALLPPVEAEFRLLLAAGIWSLWREAGQMPVEVRLPAAAAPDTRQPVSETIQRLIEECLAGQWPELWPEMAERLHRHGYRLRPERILPVLERVRSGQHARLRPLLGERGSWLAGQNPEWAWARQVAEGADLASLWLDGTLEQRVDALSQVRAQHPAQARDQLQQVWHGEKAEIRHALLEVLASGLAADDAPWLQQCLSDRAPSVRQRAAQLLVQLPDSTLRAQLVARAQEWLRWQPGPEPAADQLQSNLPSQWLPELAQLGLVEKPPNGWGKRQFWLQQLLSLTPPSTWLDQGCPTPELWLMSAQRHEWAAAMLAGIQLAVVRFADADWAQALYRLRSSLTELELSPDLYRQIPLAQRQDWALTDPQLLCCCPHPWPAALQTAAIQALLQALQEPGTRRLDFIGWMALTLPPRLLAELRPQWQRRLEALAEHGRYQQAQAIAELTRHLDLMDRRTQFDQEIPL